MKTVRWDSGAGEVYMHQVIEAVIDETGRVFLTEPVRFPEKRRALVIVLDDTAAVDPFRTNSVPSTKASEGGFRYRIDRPLGAGGMGLTYLGTDLQTGQTVCIKQLRPDLGSALILQEWKSLSRVDSRFVVRFLDRYDLGGTVHIVMEYVDGSALAERLRTGLPSGECAWLGWCLMQALRAFHELDVIHCDLKPQNVLIQDLTLVSQGEPGWVPKVIDFGLAVLDQHDADGCATAWGRVAGTPAYMAPEQINGLMLSPACDVYAVGLILWEALCGRRAFTGDSFSIMEAKVAQKDGLRIESAVVGAPTGIIDLVERCTHPHPARRPTAAEAVKRLEQYVTVSAEASTSTVL
jgi:serine/threonine protein kinase